MLFIEEESRIASDPTFGRQVFTKKVSAPKEENNEKVKVKCYAVNMGSMTEDGTCVFCGGIHAVDTCSEFAGIPLLARQNFFRRNDLCFGCLKPGHRSRWCKERMTCAVCERRTSFCASCLWPSCSSGWGSPCSFW